MGTIQNGNYISQYTGDQIDAALGKALNPDTAPTAGSTNLITSGGVYNGLQRKSNTNLLDNWYFVCGGSQQGGGQFPINQRGQTSYSGTGYGIDRWVHYADNGGIELQASGLYLHGAESIVQRMESALTNALVGRTITASVLTADGQLFTGSATLNAYGSGRQYINSQPEAAQILMIDNGNYRAMQFFATIAITPIAVKLELGDHQTLAHQENGAWVLNDPPPNYQQELAKCQRYQELISSSFTGGAYSPVGYGMVADDAEARVTVPYFVAMAKIPTIIVSGSFELFAPNDIHPCVISYDTASNRQISLCCKASGLTIGKMYQLRKANDSAASILLDANL